MIFELVWPTYCISPQGHNLLVLI